MDFIRGNLTLGSLLSAFWNWAGSLGTCKRLTICHGAEESPSVSMSFSRVYRPEVGPTESDPQGHHGVSANTVPQPLKSVLQDDLAAVVPPIEVVP